MSKIVGIVAPGTLYTTTNSREDVYPFGNNYAKRVTECGAIPMGILPADGWTTEEALERCDAFLICGGKKNWPYHFQVVEHALRTGKPLLGICLGMQTIHRVFKTLDYMEENGLTGDVWTAYEQWRGETPSFLLEDVENHWGQMVNGKEDECKHPVMLKEGCNLQKITGKSTVYGGSFHRYRVTDPSPRLDVTGLAEDGTIEVMEYKDQILGVQFHPEIDKDLFAIFEKFFG